MFFIHRKEKLCLTQNSLLLYTKTKMKSSVWLVLSFSTNVKKSFEFKITELKKRIFFLFYSSFFIYLTIYNNFSLQNNINSVFSIYIISFSIFSESKN